MPSDVMAQIAARTVRGNPDDCFAWTGWTDNHGYPKIGNNLRVTRLLLGLTKGDGLSARHTCDNPGCVNPRHLIPGTHVQNMQDMVDRQRQPRGERRRNAKLNAEIVTAIRLDPRSSNAIAAQVGVSGELVTKIKRGERWTHVPMPDGAYAPTRFRFKELSPRQQRIFDVMQDGVTSPTEIARRTGLGVPNVATQQKRIAAKGFRVDSVSEAA